MLRISVMLVAALGALALSGCNRGGTLSDAEAGAGDSSVFGENGASTSGFGDGGNLGVFEDDAIQQRQSGLLSELVLYFDFDRSEVPAQYNEVLAAHGQFLAMNPNAQVRLEGHADERGSREYNIALAERRAQSVRNILLLQGASQQQLSVVSYGEERPAAIGSSEEAYSLNRRVEIVYR